MNEDLDRLRAEYADRAQRLAHSDIYSHFNPAYLFAVHQRQRQLIDLLRRQGITSLRDLRILEVGCGRGGVLLEWLSFGASPKNLHGIDLLEDRLPEASARLSQSGVACADGQSLPYPDSSFDIVFQYTAFSSVLDDAVKQNIAREMLRVVRKSTGVIIWYDFWLNPTNAQTKGVRPEEIRRLFPECQYEFRRVTLAPPLARRLAPISTLLCAMLEKLQLLNTHYFAAIRPRAI